MSTSANIDDIDSLLTFLGAGLLPNELTESEVALLVEHYGQDWFTELGYTETTERSLFDVNNRFF